MSRLVVRKSDYDALKAENDNLFKLLDTAEGLVRRLKSENGAIAAELAALREANRKNVQTAMTAHERVQALEAALRWALRRVLTKDNAAEALFHQYRKLANYAAETGEKHSS